MKNALFETIFVASIGLFCMDMAAQMVRVHSVYSVEHEVDGTLFTFQEEVSNGQVRRQWLIDGDAATATEYEQELLHAQMSERRKERAAQEHERIREQEQKMAVVLHGHKKMLEVFVEQCRSWLKKYADTALRSYLTESVKEQVDRIQATVADAHALLNQPHIDLEKIEQMIHAVQPLPQTLKDLFYRSAHEAIERCDDTRILKNLLEMVDERTRRE